MLHGTCEAFKPLQLLMFIQTDKLTFQEKNITKTKENIRIDG